MSSKLKKQIVTRLPKTAEDIKEIFESSFEAIPEIQSLVIGRKAHYKSLDFFQNLRKKPGGPEYIASKSILILKEKMTNYLLAGYNFQIIKIKINYVLSILDLIKNEHPDIPDILKKIEDKNIIITAAFAIKNELTTQVIEYCQALFIILTNSFETIEEKKEAIEGVYKEFFSIAKLYKDDTKIYVPHVYKYNLLNDLSSLFLLLLYIDVFREIFRLHDENPDSPLDFTAIPGFLRNPGLTDPLPGSSTFNIETDVDHMKYSTLFAFILETIDDLKQRQSQDTRKRYNTWVKPWMEEKKAVFNIGPSLPSALPPKSKTKTKEKSKAPAENAEVRRTRLEAERLELEKKELVESTRGLEEEGAILEKAGELFNYVMKEAGKIEEAPPQQGAAAGGGGGEYEPKAKVAGNPPLSSKASIQEKTVPIRERLPEILSRAQVQKNTKQIKIEKVRADRASIPGLTFFTAQHLLKKVFMRLKGKTIDQKLATIDSFVSSSGGRFRSTPFASLVNCESAEGECTELFDNTSPLTYSAIPDKEKFFPFPSDSVPEEMKRNFEKDFNSLLTNGEGLYFEFKATRGELSFIFLRNDIPEGDGIEYHLSISRTPTSAMSHQQFHFKNEYANTSPYLTPLIQNLITMGIASNNGKQSVYAFYTLNKAGALEYVERRDILKQRRGGSRKIRGKKQKSKTRRVTKTT